METSALLPVHFHNSTLYVFEKDGEPFTPMRQIIEGMGMAFEPQRRKLLSNKGRWGTTIMVLPSRGGSQEAICMPVRKLPGFFSTIHPAKVSPALRPTIIRYQNECDEVLFRHWSGTRTRREVNPSTRAVVEALVAARREVWLGFMKLDFNTAEREDIIRICQAGLWLDGLTSKAVGKEASLSLN